MTILPKELRQIPSGHIFGYTEALAARNDMVPYWRDGHDPNAPSNGLSLEGGRENSFRKAIEQKDAEIAQLNQAVDALQSKINELLGENAKYLAIINGAKEPDEPVVEEPLLANNERIDIIKAAIDDIVSEKNPDELTAGTGLPKIEAIEERTGFTDVTSAERKLAMEQ